MSVIALRTFIVIADVTLAWAAIEQTVFVVMTATGNRFWHLPYHHFHQRSIIEIETVAAVARVSCACRIRHRRGDLIQRFGSALNLNVHLQMLVPDGVYERTEAGLLFHSVLAPTQPQLRGLLDKLSHRIGRSLERHG